MSFEKRKTNSQKSFNVAVAFCRGKVLPGAVGLEIEVEGNKFPKPDGQEGVSMPVPLPGSKVWSYVHDGSLRGADNAEYVLTTPVMFDDVPAALDELYARLKKYGSVIDSSRRTSTHVHLNVQPFHLNRLTSLMALYIILEEVLTEWCGEHRVGNLFCLRAKDAPAVVSQLRRFIRSNMEAPIKEHHRYAGMNGNSIQALGSLEFRALRGVPEPKAIVEWVGILRRLYELSASYPDPREVCGDFSGHGPLGFFREVLGAHSEVVRRGVKMSDQQIEASLHEGIRMAQDLCFARDWSMFKGIELQPDPFGRDINKIKRRLTNDEGVGEMPDATGLPGGITIQGYASQYTNVAPGNANHANPAHTLGPAGSGQAPITYEQLTSMWANAVQHTPSTPHGWDADEPIPFID